MKQFIKYILGLVVVFGLGSCLKDKGFENGQYGIDVTKLGEIITMSAAKNEATAVAVNFVNTSQTVTMSGITYEADQNSSKDIRVTVALDPAALTAYNAAHPTAQLTVLPAAWYTISNVVTIASGARVGNLTITIPNATLLDVSTTYGVAITIQSNDGGVPIASNLKTAVFQVSAKNKYDGLYRLTLGQDAGWLAFGIGSNVVDVYPPDIELITAGATAVTINARAPSPFAALQPGWAGGAGVITGYTAFGATTPKYTFDPATEKAVSVINTTPDDGRGRTLFLDPASTTSGYDVNTKTVYLEYFLTQTGRPNLRFTTRYSYIGPR